MNKETLIKLIEDKLRSIDNSGKSYYNYKPKSDDVNEINTMSNGKIHTIQKQKKVFVYTNYFKALVDQKIDYLLSKEPIIEEILPEEFDIHTILDEASLMASQNKVSWLHLYINDYGKLDWILNDDNNIIPVYDNYNKYITKIVRFFIEDKITKVEIWTDESFTTLDIEGKDINQDTIKTEKHYTQIIKYSESEEEQKKELKSFGFIPFIPLWNNKFHNNDLVNIKELIKYYNEISSGFIDNINKFQEFLLILKGLGGQDLDELLTNLRKFKAMNIPEEAKADYLSVEIPVEARKIILDILKKNIFLLGRGVDLNDLQGAGSNITNVLITAMYTELNLKANDCEKQMKIFYRQLISNINKYYGTSYDDKIIFNRSQIFNETERIDNCQKSMGIISMKTIRENHPFVKSLEEEEERIEKEKEAYSLLNEEEVNNNG